MKKIIISSMQRWSFLFNAVIDGLDLRELEMSGRKYTWVNYLKNPTFERLDRVLVSTEWEQHYPLATIVALSREISNHTPLLLNTGKKKKVAGSLCSSLN